MDESKPIASISTICTRCGVSYNMYAPQAHKLEDCLDQIVAERDKAVAVVNAARKFLKTRKLVHQHARASQVELDLVKLVKAFDERKGN